MPLGDFRDWMRSNLQSATPQDILALLFQIAEGLDYVHSRGVVHLDIKPENIFMGGSLAMPFPCIGDFCLSTVDTNTTYIPASSLIGTSQYMAPERFRNLKGAPPADIYSFGIIIYEIFEGSPPFTGDNIPAISLQHLASPIPQNERVHKALTRHGFNILRKALAKDPDDRYSSAIEFITALGKVLHPKTGQVIGGKYTIEKKMTDEATGEIYLATTEEGQPVAIELMNYNPQQAAGYLK